MTAADYVAEREARRAAAASRAAALDAAAAAIARWVPNLPGLIAQLEHAGGNSRLVVALRARNAGAKPAAEIGGRPRPDPALWAKGSWR